MSRGLGAALIAAAVVLSGCGADDGEDTTTSPPPEASVNPWDLPLEERPELFDPCAEIPVEAVEEALGGPVEPDEQLTKHEPDELLTCGWKNDHFIFGVIGTWQSRQELLTDSNFGPFDTSPVVSGRPSVQAQVRTDKSARSCYQAFYTSRGAVIFNATSISYFSELRGERGFSGCQVLDRTIDLIMPFVPEGDF